ncbi:MAG TPA: DUF2530 domain-containing protein [Propionibacteriaceae bacterium]|nr:DUF2530 domain-containing protein [Propionibacteriaceae bacterium]
MESAHRHALVQAPVDPVDEDGIVASYVGTAVSAVASLILWWRLDWLTARGQEWWLWVAATATGAGVLFSVYARDRKRRRLTPLDAPPDRPASVEQ